MSTETVDDSSADRQSASFSQRPLGALLKYVYLSFDRVATDALAPYGIDRRELAVLTRLAGGELVSQQEVARRLGIDRTTMVALIDGLEQKQLVQRRPHPDDRRKNIVALTTTGRQSLAHATPAAVEAERRFLEPLGQTDAGQFQNALRSLLAAWEMEVPARQPARLSATRPRDAGRSR